VPKKPAIQPVYKPICKDEQRIPIPANFCEAAGLGGKEPLEVSLWMVGKGRYRILAGENAHDPEIESLRTKISEREGPTVATEFDDNAATVLNIRLLSADIKPGKEKRLSLADIIMDSLKIRSERRAVIVLDGRFVEIWSVETFEETYGVPTAELL
jgi:hypothetical protein